MKVWDRVVLAWWDVLQGPSIWPSLLFSLEVSHPVVKAWGWLIGYPAACDVARGAISRRCKACEAEKGNRCKRWSVGCWDD